MRREFAYHSEPVDCPVEPGVSLVVGSCGVLVVGGVDGGCGEDGGGSELGGSGMLGRGLLVGGGAGGGGGGALGVVVTRLVGHVVVLVVEATRALDSGATVEIGGRTSGGPEVGGSFDVERVSLIVMSGGGVAVLRWLPRDMAAIVANPVAITMPAPASITRLFGLAS